MPKSAQNNSFNSGTDAALDGALHDGINAALEGAP